MAAKQEFCNVSPKFLPLFFVTLFASVSALNERRNFFEGKDVDAAYFPLHKSQKFIGLEKLPTFIVHDFAKSPGVKNVKTNYLNHL